MLVEQVTGTFKKMTFV